MNTPHGLTVLVARAGEFACGIPLPHVAEVMRPLPIESLTGAPHGVVGISMIRGNPAPVVNLAALLTGEENGTNWPRLVTVLAGTRTVGMLVEGVTDVREIPADHFATLPPLWQGDRPPAVTAVGALDRELFFVLDSMKLLPDGLPEIDVEAEA